VKSFTVPSRALDELRYFYIKRGLSFISETVFSDTVGAKLSMLRTARGRFQRSVAFHRTGEFRIV
jgi:hypothetical protein